MKQRLFAVWLTLLAGASTAPAAGTNTLTDLVRKADRVIKLDYGKIVSDSAADPKVNDRSPDFISTPPRSPDALVS